MLTTDRFFLISILKKMLQGGLIFQGQDHRQITVYAQKTGM